MKDSLTGRQEAMDVQVMSEENQNPLSLDPKREKSGSLAFDKFEYQYHWAFCRLLDEHGKGQEYALFVEEHEDVTLATTLSADTAEFELNQVKAVKTPFSIDALCKVKKGENNSIVGKLALSATNKKFSHKVKQVNLVASSGFKFDLHSKGFSFQVISSGQLSEEESKKVRESMAAEAGSDGLFPVLGFVVSDLPEKSYEAVVVGRISSLISAILPGANYNSSIIYDCVITDLRRKGKNKYDYSDWDDAIKNRAVTSSQIANLIVQNTSRRTDDGLKQSLSEALASDYAGLSFINRQKISAAFQRYYMLKLADRSTELNAVSNDINAAVLMCSKNDVGGLMALQSLVRDLVSDATAQYFQSEHDFSGAFLYEFLTNENL